MLRPVALAFAFVLGLAVAPTPSAANEFRPINDRDTFVQIVKDRELKRLGITLQVSEAGEIAGRAFGRSVSGEWQWSDDGYFCRDLYFGEEALGPNCQLVQLNGSTLRFTSDRGEGIYADLRLR